MMGEVRRLFAGLIGAGEAEIALAHCTKAGEQLVLDGLPSLRRGGNVVTNDLHFSGSLHNLIGLQKAGMDVRIVRNRDWRIDLDAMRQAIDNRTALVSVSLVSNVNGWVEPMRPLAELAHRSGAYVYADIIQAAGILPFQVADLGIDFAACSGYKWLYGPHGVGFLYVRRDLQEGGLQQRLFPGHASCNYPPWTQELAAGAPAFEYTPPVDASRYQPGHVGYLGYAALLEGLRFVLATGVEAALKHSTGLINRLRDRLDPDRYRCISDPAQPSPMATFIAANPVGIHDRLASAGIVVAVSGNRIRVSPAAYNIEEDVDALAEALNRVSP